MQVNKIGTYNNTNNSKNSNQAFGMAVNKIFTDGMADVEKKIIIDSFDKITELAKDVDFTIGVKQISNGGQRHFEVIASTPGQIVTEGFDHGRYLSCYNLNNKEESIRNSLFDNIRHAKDNYFAHCTDQLASKK